jgi:hypothetical protein
VCYELLLDIVEGAIDISTTTSSSTSFAVSGITSRQAGSVTESRDADSGLCTPTTSNTTSATPTTSVTPINSATTSFSPSLIVPAITVITDKYSPGKSIEKNFTADPGSDFTPAVNLLDDITVKEIIEKGKGKDKEIEEKDRDKSVEKGEEKGGEKEKENDDEKERGGDKERFIERDVRDIGEITSAVVTTVVKTQSECILECAGSEGEGTHAHTHTPVTPTPTPSADPGPDDGDSLSLSVSLPLPFRTDTSGSRKAFSLLTTPSPITPETVPTLTRLP